MYLYEYEQLFRQASKVVDKLNKDDFDSKEFLKMHKRARQINGFTNYHFAKEYHRLFKKLIKPLI